MSFFHAFYFVSYMGTTIGFGEIPYAFTDAQRLWAIVGIYATVITWLYSIGATLSAFQDASFQSLLKENAFRRAVNRITEPFFLVCGYGDTGSLLIRALSASGYRAIVIDKSQDRITALELEDLGFPVPGLCADAADPDNLVLAGLSRANCRGAIALTDIDDVNLKITITSKLLNPAIPAIARAESREIEANMASFGTDEIINPFDTFAGRLAMSLRAPGLFLLFEWMTAVPHQQLREPVFPPHGRWVLCGYGRFGKAVHQRLLSEDIELTFIEAMPQKTDSPAGTITGRGTEADTLLEADIKNAVGIIAGTDNDANNLSIIMTARMLNPALFVVARQNYHQNDSIFAAANLDLSMQRGSVIANKIFALITTPLLSEFLQLALMNSNDWANQLVSRIGGIAGAEVPRTWTLNIDPQNSPALHSGIESGMHVCIGDIYRDPRSRDERLACVALLIMRGRDEYLLPEDDFALQSGDRILFCGRLRASVQMEWIAKNFNIFDYILTGTERTSGTLWRWLEKKYNNFSR